MAPCNASTEPNGRAPYARLATHGECSKMAPSSASNAGRASPFNSARVTAKIYYRVMISTARIMARCDALARHSEQPGGLTRVFLSPENRAASELVLGWMREAGMRAAVDAIGNVVGRYEAERTGAPCLMLGSHLDTVRDAGRYDGMLGVVTAIECVGALKGRRLPFATQRSE